MLPCLCNFDEDARYGEGFGLIRRCCTGEDQLFQRRRFLLDGLGSPSYASANSTLRVGLAAEDEEGSVVSNVEERVPVALLWSGDARTECEAD